MVTQPLRMHRVQTRIRFTPPPAAVRTSCRLGCHRRLVLLLAWLTLLPTEGRLPQISQVRIGGSAVSLDWIDLIGIESNAQSIPLSGGIKEAAARRSLRIRGPAKA